MRQRVTDLNNLSVDDVREADDLSGRTRVLEKREMCRSIRVLFNLDPPTTEDEILAASLQFVRKISGVNKPTKANEAAFFTAVEDIARISGRLLDALESTAPPKNRQDEAARAKARAARRFGR